jgi:hypothetical protein
MTIKFLQKHCNVFRPKNLTPWRDSNPGSSSVAMTTIPRRQGKSVKNFAKCGSSLKISLEVHIFNKIVLRQCLYYLFNTQTTHTKSLVHKRIAMTS